MKKKILSVLLMLISAMAFGRVSFAEDLNPFPPQTPQVGVMKVCVSSYDTVVMGLRTNGTVNVMGVNSESAREWIKTQTNVVDIACCTDMSVGIAAVLDSAGSVKIRKIEAYEHYFNDFPGWDNIAAIDCGKKHLVGLKTDGTVVAHGDNTYGQCDVNGWNNVSKIYANYDFTIGIKKDGTVYAAGKIDNYSDIAKLKNVISVSANGNKCIATTADGAVEGTYTKVFTFYQDDKSYEIPVSEVLKHEGIDAQIKALGECYKYQYIHYILDNHNTLYKYTNKLEKLHENIVCLVTTSENYYALDENGHIWSSDRAFTSDDWILTTNITYNGKKVNSDVPPYVKDGRTLAPMRAILEALGMTVSWDPASQTVTAVKADINISISINSNIAIVNNDRKSLDVPAEITNGRTFVPVRFFAEVLGMNVDWDAYTKTVSINE